MSHDPTWPEDYHDGAQVIAAMRAIVYRGRTAYMSKLAFEELMEYSTSVPGGVYPEKRWKRRCGSIDRAGRVHHEEPEQWLLGGYSLHDFDGKLHPDPANRCFTLFWDIVIGEPPMLRGVIARMDP